MNLESMDLASLTVLQRNLATVAKAATALSHDGFEPEIILGADATTLRIAPVWPSAHDEPLLIENLSSIEIAPASDEYTDPPLSDPPPSSGMAAVAGPCGEKPAAGASAKSETILSQSPSGDFRPLGSVAAQVVTSVSEILPRSESTGLARRIDQHLSLLRRRTPWDAGLDLGLVERMRGGEKPAVIALDYGVDTSDLQKRWRELTASVVDARGVISVENMMLLEAALRRRLAAGSKREG